MAPNTPGQPIAFPPAPTPNPFPGGTTLGEAIANSVVEAQNDRDRMNANDAAIYKLKYAAYVENMQSGQNVPLERQQPPIPPFAWELTPPDELGFVRVQRSATTRVCPQGPAVSMNAANPQVKDSLVENTIDIGPRIFSGGSPTAFFSTGPKDSWPANKQTPPMPPDMHVYLKLPAPVGGFTVTFPDGTVGEHGGWYEQVS